jgi:hypothetical protein
VKSKGSGVLFEFASVVGGRMSGDERTKLSRLQTAKYRPGRTFYLCTFVVVSTMSCTRGLAVKQSADWLRD